MSKSLNPDSLRIFRPFPLVLKKISFIKYFIHKVRLSMDSYYVSYRERFCRVNFLTQLMITYMYKNIFHTIDIVFTVCTSKYTCFIISTKTLKRQWDKSNKTDVTIKVKSTSKRLVRSLLYKKITSNITMIKFHYVVLLV